MSRWSNATKTAAIWEVVQLRTLETLQGDGRSKMVPLKKRFFPKIKLSLFWPPSSVVVAVSCYKRSLSETQKVTILVVRKKLRRPSWIRKFVKCVHLLFWMKEWNGTQTQIHLLRAFFPEFRMAMDFKTWLFMDQRCITFYWVHMLCSLNYCSLKCYKKFLNACFCNIFWK